MASPSDQFLYTTINSVKVRLMGKVQFQTENPPLDGELPDALLCQLIQDAETDVEQELRSRYAIPFRSIGTNKFSDLPDHTKRAIRQVVDLKAVMKVLETDFGRGTHINPEGYYDPNKSEYKAQIMRLLGKDRMGEGADRFKYSPPLEGLLLAAHNREADDGFRGMIINTDASTNDAATYAQNNVNNPARSYIRRRGIGGL